jgi:peptidoglycan/xylan/chitin deacetylase (PgdA/CDA1 family)
LLAALKKFWLRYHSVDVAAAAAVAAADPCRVYGELCRRQGFTELTFLLSFDCDTAEDAVAANELDPWLRRIGVKTTYAVPGANLQALAGTYRRLADQGAEFINHGARAHAEKREDGLYHAITFYNQMNVDEVVADIETGHAIVERVIGRAPLGFRTPHFGCYQAREQCETLYATARRLGYAYCSGMLPAFGLEHGPVVDVGGLMELPLSGSLRSPTTVLDSWNYFYEERRLRDEYAELMIETADYYVKNGLPAVLNYYVDPAHVAGVAAFRRAIEHLIGRGAKSTSFLELVDFVRSRAGADSTASNS